MKKLMIAACAVVCATMAQAVTVNWSCGGIVDSKGVGLPTTTQMSTYTAVATFYAAVAHEDVPGVITYTVGDKITDSNGTFQQMGGVIGQFSGSWNGAGTTTHYFAQLVLTDKDGATLTSEMSHLLTTGSATLSPNFGIGTGGFVPATPATSKFDQSGPNYGWAVPEPTSGLLLLLGVAGLALKRKRA